MMPQVPHLVGDEMVTIGSSRIPRLLRFEGLKERWTWRHVRTGQPRKGEWYVRDALSIAYRADFEFSGGVYEILAPDAAYGPTTTYRLLPTQPSRIP